LIKLICELKTFPAKWSVRWRTFLDELKALPLCDPSTVRQGTFVPYADKIVVFLRCRLPCVRLRFSRYTPVKIALTFALLMC